MKIFKFAALLLVTGIVFVGSASAFRQNAIAQTSGQNCHMEETTTISFNLSGTESDIKKIKGLIDQKADEVKTLAADAKVAAIDLQNYSYNVYPNNSSGAQCGANGAGSYQYSASYTFGIKSADIAPDFAALLTSKGYNVSLNVNSYKQCQ